MLEKKIRDLHFRMAEDTPSLGRRRKYSKKELLTKRNHHYTICRTLVQLMFSFDLKLVC